MLKAIRGEDDKSCEAGADFTAVTIPHSGKCGWRQKFILLLYAV